MDKPIEFKHQDGALRRLMVAFEAPCGDYGETEADERDATEADLIDALQANDELRANVFNELLELPEAAQAHVDMTVELMRAKAELERVSAERAELLGFVRRNFRAFFDALQSGTRGALPSKLQAASDMQRLIEWRGILPTKQSPAPAEPEAQRERMTLAQARKYVEGMAEASGWMAVGRGLLRYIDQEEAAESDADTAQCELGKACAELADARRQLQVKADLLQGSDDALAELRAKLQEAEKQASEAECIFRGLRAEAQASATTEEPAVALRKGVFSAAMHDTETEPPPLTRADVYAIVAELAREAAIAGTGGAPLAALAEAAESKRGER